MKRYIYLTATASQLLLGLALLSGCSGHRGEASEALSDSMAYSADTVSLPGPVAEVRMAVREGRAEAFASLVSYPLARPYPLRDIRDRDEMVKYYPVLVDDSLRRMIADSSPNRWTESGWKGWMLDSGTVWIDDSLYSVNYVSVSERKELGELLSRDSLSLAPSLRKGWRPVACMKSIHHGAVYRLDYNPRLRDGRAYRLAVWQPGDSLSGKPSLIFRGQRKDEGSAGISTYFFANQAGAKAVYSGDITSLDDLPRVLFTYPSGEATADTVQPVYWLDLVSK